MDALQVLAAIACLIGVPVLFVWLICKCAEGAVEHIHPGGKHRKGGKR